MLGKKNMSIPTRVEMDCAPDGHVTRNNKYINNFKSGSIA